MNLHGLLTALLPGWSGDDLQALALSAQLAVSSTAILLVLGTPLAWWLTWTRSPLRRLVASVVALPLVLPPTVLGFYLLICLGPQGPVGHVMQRLGLGLLPFTFEGLVVASAVQTLPFVVQPLHQAFTAMGEGPLELAATLGAGPLDRFWTVALPLARPGLATALILGLAHALGEFGVVLMIGGNIPGVTRVLSVALYSHVEAQEWDAARALAGGMLVLGFALMWLLQGIRAGSAWGSGLAARPRPSAGTSGSSQ